MFDILKLTTSGHFDHRKVDHPTDAYTVEGCVPDPGHSTAAQEEASARDGRRRTDQEDARAVHSASHRGDRGFQVIGPTWNPGRFSCWLCSYIGRLA